MILSVWQWIKQHKILSFLILNEIRGLIMTAPIWYVLFSNWFHLGH